MSFLLSLRCARRLFRQLVGFVEIDPPYRLVYQESRRGSHGFAACLVRDLLILAGVLLVLAGSACPATAEGDWEITPQSEKSLQDGLAWLARNQGPEGNWDSPQLGLVSMGVLAFLADGHFPGRGRYGQETRRALDYIVRRAKPSGLLNIAEAEHDMYNHGLATFVLGQAYGMSSDAQIGVVLDRALKLIVQVQSENGGWDYRAVAQAKGHDLSLAVMQAKALRGAVDSGLEVPPEVIDLAIRSVRKHYTPSGCPPDAPEERQRQCRGQFTYTPRGKATLAMAAAGVVCLQEFAQYDDWRIAKSMQTVIDNIRGSCSVEESARVKRAPFDPYTTYYVGQALYQLGGGAWRSNYPILRDCLVASQIHDPDRPTEDGKWRAQAWVTGKPGDMYMTAVACFVLAMPNRYLPILQEGKISSLERQFPKRTGR